MVTAIEILVAWIVISVVVAWVAGLTNKKKKWTKR